MVRGGTVTISSCTISGNTASDVRSSSKVPNAPLETHVLLLVCRVAVSLSSVLCAGTQPMPTYSPSRSPRPRSPGTQLVRCGLVFKIPHRPMGKMLMCLPRLTLAQLRTLRSTTGCTCSRELEKFPTPRWETHVLLVFGRVAVSVSSVSHQCQS